MAVRAASGGILPARCIRGHVASSGRIREGRFFARHSETRGMFRGRFEEGFRGDSRQGFRDIRHFSKETFGEMASGLAFGTGGTLRRTVRQGFRRKLRKEAFGRASGRFRKAPKEGGGGRGLGGTPFIF